jgi:vacuolar-type H+-ATPase subunit E/Vma4
MNLTYRELRRQLSAMSEEWLDANVTIHLSNADEYFAVKRMLIYPETDVLDEGHPFLEIVE